MKLKRVIKDWITEPDGESFDPMPVLAIIGTVFVLVIVGHSYFVRETTFDISQFGIGLGALWAAAAGSSRLRPMAGFDPYSGNYRGSRPMNPIHPRSPSTEPLE